MDLQAYIRDIPDFPRPGIVFKDITPLLAEPKAFREAIDRLAARYRQEDVQAVAAAEARGFLFAAPLALELQAPLIILRKPGKLPYYTHAHQYELEYGSGELHMHVDSLRPGTKVLLVDDVLATGGTMEAGCRLVEKAGGQVLGCAFLIELAFLSGRQRLAPYPVFSLISYNK
ncbi:MAG: adenine phosphoribosyltransferase [Gemmataceae bacterium]|mgnify:CR=1 FL=1